MEFFCHVGTLDAIVICRGLCRRNSNIDANMRENRASFVPHELVYASDFK